MKDWRTVWTRGPCKGCGKKFEDRECRHGFCMVCRQPAESRELVKYGVLPQSANMLMNLMWKCKVDAERVLGIVHPVLMQNIKVVDRTLRVRDKQYRWFRRGNWVKAKEGD